MTATLSVQAEAIEAQGIYREALTDHSVLDQHETFTPAERNLIRAHLLGRQPANRQENDKELPFGLQKKVFRGKNLPSGWQEKVAPGHSLDYQLYRQAERLPDNLLRRLPPTPVGAEILQVENKVVLINSTTRAILDAFDLTPTR
jgi:hypothetical protein